MEAAVTRILRERQQRAAQFSETAVGEQLREASSADLAAIASAALASTTSQARPAPRPVTEVAVDPRSLSIEEMGLAALAGSAGNSPIWTYQRSNQHGTVRS